MLDCDEFNPIYTLPTFPKRVIMKHVLQVALAIGLLLSSSLTQAAGETVSVTRETFEGTFQLVIKTQSNAYDTFKDRSNLFGVARGIDRQQSSVASITIKGPGSEALTFPASAIEDLFNPGILERLLSVRCTRSMVQISFSGGDGEKAYRVIFEWQREDKQLVRTVSRLHFGAWRSVWRCNGKKWKVQENRKPLKDGP